MFGYIIGAGNKCCQLELLSPENWSIVGWGPVLLDHACNLYVGSNSNQNKASDPTKPLI